MQDSTVDVRTRMLLRACAIVAFLFALLLVLAAAGMAIEIAP